MKLYEIGLCLAGFGAGFAVVWWLWVRDPFGEW